MIRKISCLYLMCCFLCCAICCMAQDDWTNRFYDIVTDELVTNPPMFIKGFYLMTTNEFYTVETNELYYVIASWDKSKDKECISEDVIAMVQKKDPDGSDRSGGRFIPVGGREIWRHHWVVKKAYHSIGDKVVPVENNQIAFFSSDVALFSFWKAAEQGKDGEFLFTARRITFMEGIAEKYNLQGKLLLLIIGNDRYFPMPKGNWWYKQEMEKIEKKILESSSTTNSAIQETLP